MGQRCFITRQEKWPAESHNHIESSSRTANLSKYIGMDREKKLKTDDEDDDGIDRISELPNSILCHILSLLPTKEFAATSILSTRWKFLFAFVPDIDLECSYSSDNSFLDFFKLCNRMILLRQGIPIRKLKLSLWRISERLRVILEPSIISALQCRIQELEVFVDHLEPSTVQVQGFPHGIFSCVSLVKLKLSSRGAISSDLPDTVSLPNLKVLHLDLRLCVNEFSIHRLILGCPRLKDLRIGFISTRYCDTGSKKKSKVLDFSSPSLNKLVLDSILVGSSNLETLDYRLNSYCDDGSEKVVINAPNLKHLATESPLCRLSFVESLKNLVEAKITAEYYHVHGLSGEDVIDHLHRAQNVESICIGRVILEAIQVHGCLHLLPTFKNLKSLELEFKKDRRFKSSHMYAWRALPFFFNSTPNLEVLVFNHVNWGKNDGGIESFVEDIFPICFIKKLKGIEIKAFGNQECEFKLVEHLLQHGKALRKVTIGELLETSVSTKILSFKKCSNLCQVVFV